MDGHPDHVVVRTVIRRTSPHSLGDSGLGTGSRWCPVRTELTRVPEYPGSTPDPGRAPTYPLSFVENLR